MPDLMVMNNNKGQNGSNNNNKANTKTEMVSCYRSTGSICVPRKTTPGQPIIALPKVNVDADGQDELRRAFRMGLGAKKAVAKFKKATKNFTNLKPIESNSNTNQNKNSDVCHEKLDNNNNNDKEKKFSNIVMNKGKTISNNEAFQAINNVILSPLKSQCNIKSEENNKNFSNSETQSNQIQDLNSNNIIANIPENKKTKTIVIETTPKAETKLEKCKIAHLENSSLCKIKPTDHDENGQFNTKITNTAQQIEENDTRLALANTNHDSDKIKSGDSSGKSQLSGNKIIKRYSSRKSKDESKSPKVNKNNLSKDESKNTKKKNCNKSNLGPRMSIAAVVIDAGGLVTLPAVVKTPQDQLNCKNIIICDKISFVSFKLNNASYPELLKLNIHLTIPEKIIIEKCSKKVNSANNTISHDSMAKDLKINEASLVELGDEVTWQSIDDLSRKHMSNMYGVVQMITQRNEADHRITKGTKPIIHLCHRIKDNSSDDIYRSTSPQILTNLQDQLRERSRNNRREERKLRKMASLPTPNELAADDDFMHPKLSNYKNRLVEEEENSVEARIRKDYAWIPQKTDDKHKRTCKKHSQCHCFLFSLDTIGFYALTS